MYKYNAEKLEYFSSIIILGFEKSLLGIASSEKHCKLSTGFHFIKQ